jgi:DNA-binding CsgD family transcriptional regulator
MSSLTSWSPTGVDIPQLLERDLEVQALSAAITAAQERAGQMVIIDGPAGIGKTRLVAAARAMAVAVGFRVFGARGHELERNFPYGVAHQLYEPVLAAAAAHERVRWLSGAARLVEVVNERGEGGAADGGWLSGAAPLVEVVGGRAETAAADAEETFARLHGLYWLFANVAADRPVLVLVDDAHFADELSLRFLGFLARRVGELRLTLVVATRSARGRGQALLRDLTRDPAVVRLHPAPLSAEAVGAWIAAELGERPDAAFLDACHEVTSGYPFLVHELVHEIRNERLPLRAGAAARVRELGPEGVASVVLVRLARLPAAAGALARALAVLGDVADLGVAARLASLPEDDVRAAVDSLSEVDVLAPGRKVRFVHPIIRAAILSDVAPGDLAAQHGLAARLLYEEHAPVEHIAAHLLAADRCAGPWATEVLRAAGSDALARGGPETASKYFDRAVRGASGEQRSPLLTELGRAEAMAGKPAGVEHLRQAVELSSDPVTSARARLTLGWALKYLRPLEAYEVLETALAHEPPDRGLREALEAELLGLSVVSVAARDRVRARFAALRAPDGAPSSEYDVFVLAALAVRAADACDPFERAVMLVDRALAGAPHLAELHANAMGMIAQALALCDRFDEADRVLSSLRDLERRRGFRVGYAGVLSVRSMLQYRRGALAQAEADAVEALEIARELSHQPMSVGYAENVRNFLALERGDREELGRLVREAVNPPVGDSDARAMHSRGRLRAVTGDPRGGLADLRAVGEFERRWGTTNPGRTWWRSDAALILMGLGDQTEASRLADEELELARQFGAPRALGMALRAAALTRGRTTDLTLLEEATEVLSTSGAQLEHARALVDLGAAIRRAGRPAHARGPLRRGYELAGRCGAKALAERSMQELLAAGARPRRTALSGVESLTPSELRVAELAADGMTNREVAQALFVTEKTVETHLGRVYSKLGIAARVELPKKLVRSGKVAIPSPNAEERVTPVGASVS